MNMKPENYDWNTEDEWLALGGRESSWVTGKSSRLSIMGKFNCAIADIKKGKLQQGWNTLVLLADGGCMVAQMQVGCAYLFGWISLTATKKVHPVDKDMKMAIKYLYKAAEQGDEGALENLKEIRKDTAFDDIRTEVPPHVKNGKLFK